MGILLLAIAVQTPMTVQAQKEKRKRGVESDQSREKLQRAEALFTEGMKYFILEDYAKALGAFQQASDLNPQESMIYFKMAEVYTKSSHAEDLNRAAANIEKALKLNRKNVYFYSLAAQIYALQNNFPKAEETLETLTREIDGTGEYLYQLAEIYIYDKKLDEALKTYNRAEAQMGINEISSMQKQKIYMEQGKMDQAIAEGEKLMAAYPDEERIAMVFAETLSQKGEKKKAIGVLEKFLATHPESGRSRILLAAMYREDGREVESRDMVTQAMADPSVDISSKILVLQTYTAQIAQQGARKVSDPDLEKFATNLYDELKRQYPGEPDVYIAGGNLYMSLQNKPIAEQAFLGAIQRGSASFEAWQNLLALEAESGKFEDLIFHSEQGLEIFPNQALLYYFNGYGNLSQKNYRQACAALEQARKLSAANPGLVHDINSMLGDAYNGLKDYVKSDQAFEAALAHSPNDALVLNNYSYYLALRKEHLEKAEKMSARVVRDYPDNSTYLDTHAWVLYVRQKYREARKVMEHALELPGVSSVHYDHYGDILFQLGDVDGAVKQWEKARTLTSDHEEIDRKIANRRLYQ